MLVRKNPWIEITVATILLLAVLPIIIVLTVIQVVLERRME
jgi:hypothetical protein